MIGRSRAVLLADLQHLLDPAPLRPGKALPYLFGRVVVGQYLADVYPGGPALYDGPAEGLARGAAVLEGHEVAHPGASNLSAVVLE